jgi:hypothetical protein
MPLCFISPKSSLLSAPLFAYFPYHHLSLSLVCQPLREEREREREDNEIRGEAFEVVSHAH